MQVRSLALFEARVARAPKPFSERIHHSRSGSAREGDCPSAPAPGARAADGIREGGPFDLVAYADSKRRVAERAAESVPGHGHCLHCCVHQRKRHNLYGDRKKTWIIDVDKSLEDDGLAREQMEKLASAARDRLSKTGAEPAHIQVGPVPDRTFVLTVAAYAFGPLAAVILRQDRPIRNIVWASLGLAAVPVWISMFVLWDDVAPWIQSGRLPFLAWFAGVGAVTAFTFAAWSRAVFLAGWDARFFPERLSFLLTNPVVTLIAGLVTPGCGLLLHNAPRRAAWTLWNAGVAVMGVLAVVYSTLLWESNAASTSGQLAPRTLEYVFLGALALAALGVLVWIGSALEGARLAANRSGHGMQGRGEWLVAGVLVALVAVSVTFRPAAMARELDRASGRWQAVGMEILPVLGATAATKLDPAQPTHALRLAALHDQRGNTRAAASIRSELDARWTAYRQALRTGTFTPKVTESSSPFVVPSMTLSGPGLSQVRAWTDSLRGVIGSDANAQERPND